MEDDDYFIEIRNSVYERELSARYIAGVIIGIPAGMGILAVVEWLI